jgi:hypothetical protein
VYSSLRRGWFFGSETFREKLLGMLAKRSGEIEKANGYHGPQLNDYTERRARGLIRAALERFGTDLATLRRARKGGWRKGVLTPTQQAIDPHADRAACRLLIEFPYPFNWEGFEEATPIKIRLPSLRHCRRIFNTRAIPALRSPTILTFSEAILGRSLLPLLVVSITGAEDDSFTRSIESEQSL